MKKKLKKSTWWNKHPIKHRFLIWRLQNAHSKKEFRKTKKDMIQILGFPEWLFLWISTLESPNQKTELDGMFIFWCWFFDFFFILADKISRVEKFWIPIQNLNSVVLWEIPYLICTYDSVRFSRNFCQNAWTLSLCAHLNNDVFWISTAVMWTRNAQVSFHNIN